MGSACSGHQPCSVSVMVWLMAMTCYDVPDLRSGAQALTWRDRTCTRAPLAGVIVICVEATLAWLLAERENSQWRGKALGLKGRH